MHGLPSVLLVLKLQFFALEVCSITIVSLYLCFFLSDIKINTHLQRPQIVAHFQLLINASYYYLLSLRLFPYSSHLALKTIIPRIIILLSRHFTLQIMTTLIQTKQLHAYISTDEWRRKGHVHLATLQSLSNVKPIKFWIS